MPQASTALTGMFQFRKGTQPNSIIVAGRELCATAITAPSAVGAFVGQAINITVDQTAPLTTRLGIYDQIFSRWRPRKLRMTYVSSLPTTAAGSVYLSNAASVLDTASDAAAIMRCEGAVTAPGYATATTIYSSHEQIKWYDTETNGTSDSGDSPGRFFFGTTGFAAATIPGYLVIDYEIEFGSPT